MLPFYNFRQHTSLTINICYDKKILLKNFMFNF
ncbi:hypothetical protein BANRA_01121 [Klebsiella pneumoniae]|nr:hypothetical protein BANRA_01121 [Klebsiella pneumoniae]